MPGIAACTLSLFPHAKATLDGVVLDASNAPGVFSQWTAVGASNAIEYVGSVTCGENLTIRGDVEVAGTLLSHGVPLQRWSNSAPDTVYLPSTFNVGIGVPEPTHALEVAGDVFATGDVLALSDARHKTALAPIGDAMEKVRALTGYTYSLTADVAPGDEGPPRRRAGLLAQEVLPVLPEAVGSRGGELNVAYSHVVALLVQGLKELSGEVEGLRGEVKGLRGEVEGLRGEVEGLRGEVEGLRGAAA